VVYGLTLPPGYEDYLIPKIAGRLLRKLYNKGGTVDPYADSTGGVVFKSGREAVEEKLAALISLLRSRYGFGYVSSNQKRDGKFRKIQLKASPLVEKREGRLDIVTRRGYTPKPEDC